MCELCKNGENIINFIMGANITSKYAVYDLGMIENVKFCPMCGRKLREEDQGEIESCFR